MCLVRHQGGQRNDEDVKENNVLGNLTKRTTSRLRQQGRLHAKVGSDDDDA